MKIAFSDFSATPFLIKAWYFSKHEIQESNGNILLPLSLHEKYKQKITRICLNYVSILFELC